MFPGLDKNLLRIKKYETLLDNGSITDIDIIDISILINRYIDINNISDVEHEYIISELKMKIMNVLFSYLSDNSETINPIIVGNDINSSNYNATMSKICNKLIYNDSNLITTGNYMSMFHSLQEFKPAFKHHGGNYLIKHGSIGTCDIYQDSFLRWDDDRVIVFDKKNFYDYKDYEIEYYPSPDIISRFKVKSKLFINKDILKTLKVYKIIDKNNYL